jgi:hypothetical protein
MAWLASCALPALPSSKATRELLPDLLRALAGGACDKAANVREAAAKLADGLTQVRPGRLRSPVRGRGGGPHTFLSTCQRRRRP